MPPRFAYWTILAGGLPTAFRAAAREELLPTYKRLLEKHPDAEMKWFARGKLWESPAAAREALEAQRRGPARPAAGRGRDWRPGGEHRDRRQEFAEAKKARNQRARSARWARKPHSAEESPPARKPWSAGKPRPPGKARATGKPRPPGASRPPGRPRPSGRPLGGPRKKPR